MAQLTHIPFLMGEASAQAVSNTALRVLGTADGTTSGNADWSSNRASPNSDRHRIIHITNCSPTAYAFVDVISRGAAAGVTTTTFGLALAPYQSYEYYVPAGYELNVIRAAVSTDNVRAREYLWP